MTKIRSSKRVSAFADSVFGEMTRLAKLHNAVNLSQGFPDFEAPQAIKDAACAAIQAEQNQYAPPYGTKAFRDAIAADYSSRYGVELVADEQVTVCCGSTEAMMASMLSCVDPGDEVIVFEPFYENYGPDAILAGAEPKYIRMREPEWRFDHDELTAAFSNRTRAIIINSPNNPTGKVFTREELQVIADLCRRWDVLAISDEIYERIVFSGQSHIPIASLPGMADRTITIGGLSKTYSVTGWRIGWAIAPAALTGGIRKLHDFLTVAAPTPFHDAGVAALSMPDAFYSQLANDYETKRDLMMEILRRHGFTAYKPGGAYYVIADVSRFGFTSDSEFAQYLVKEIGVATVPGSSFYIDPAAAPQTVRFCFSKRDETLHEADRRLARLSVTSGGRV
ncbi:MAG TPA: aminotransferase class I/II-fold pyridoxal phosphate-dependent enzyme [Vicinamibacterales bacterium]|nr:aminotransferase class I/II-fold pyridoxal phosphate-dependent enzyme [Vicinamibacterales bacterium]